MKATWQTPILVLSAALALTACRMEETVQQPDPTTASASVEATGATPEAEAVSAPATSTLRTATFAVG
ncbi:MAG: hypothetical protein ACYTG4_01820 [Planctomycetota bacterium]